MKRALPFFALAIFALGTNASAQSKRNRGTGNQGTPQDAAGKATASTGYDAFSNVKLKNIFDPTRRGLRPAEGAAAPAAAEPVKRGKSLALTGTMVTDGKSLAFFGGSAAEGTRVVSVGSSVASYKLTSVLASQVALERDGKSVVLEVGRQMTFDNGTGDAPTTAPVIEAAAEPAVEATGAPELPAAPGAAGDKSDVLRRMMERRAKEVGK